MLHWRLAALPTGRRAGRDAGQGRAAFNASGSNLSGPSRSDGDPGPLGCQVFVDTEGQVYNIQASCTHPLFCSESKRAISRVIFAPKIIDGEPQIRENVVYPLEYRLSSWSEEKQDYVTDPDLPETIRIEPCDEVPVS